MRIIEKMNSDDIRIKQVYQKLVYFKAVNFYNNNEPDSAKKYFTFSLKLHTDRVVSAESKYWLAELSYQNKAYNNAIENWQAFQEMPGSYSLKEYELANYNIGYAYFMNKNYPDAGISFRKFLLTKNLNDANKAADANLRVADCYFMNKTYNSAAEYYETAIALNKNDLDYAMYQKALCEGLQKNYKAKINDLLALQQKYPSSSYVIASTFETAESYKALNEHDQAISYYEKIISQYPGSPYVQRSIKTIGFLAYNQNKNEVALDYFKRYVKQDPGSDEAKDAIEIIKKIYKEEKKPEEMEAYLKSIGTSVSADELDETYWEKASDLYFEKKDCESATPEIKKYLNKFPTGKYTTEAHFCLAECAYSKNDFTEALPAYEYVLSKGRNIHTETALVKCSYLLYKDKKYAEALPLYLHLQDTAESTQNRLAGKLGAMRCAAFTKNNELCIDECNKVMNVDKISLPQLIEAHQLKAKALYELNRREEAATDFQYLVNNAKSESGAEAYYYLALIQFQKNEWKETEKTINKLIAYNYSTNDWNTKAMLLMADVYVQKEEMSNAEVILQTVIENADKTAYIDLANQKLKEIKDKQQTVKEAEQKKQDQMQIEFLNKGTDVQLDVQPKALKTDSLKNNPTQPK